MRHWRRDEVVLQAASAASWAGSGAISTRIAQPVQLNSSPSATSTFAGPAHHGHSTVIIVFDSILDPTGIDDPNLGGHL
jgi:hypothetical protein